MRFRAVACGLFLFLSSTVLADPDKPSHPPETASDLPTLLFVFMLASFIGLGVITRVSRLLHTPLMSLTNAISAIAVVGAIAVTGHHYLTEGKAGLNYLNILGAIALFASMTNIVSGFLLTDRMVKMFKTQAPK
jgi:NAD(P) transhydrogenase subunit alpha